MRAGSDDLARDPFELTARRTNWRDLGPRLASAAVLGPIALWCIWQGGIAWLVLIGVGFAGVTMEWARLVEHGLAAWPSLAMLAGVLAAGGAAGMQHPGLAAVLLLFTALSVWGLAVPNTHACWLAFGVLYLGAAEVALIWLRADAGGESGAIGRANVLFLVLLVWASDTGAYVFGRVFGGPKLAPRLSPGKTWSGAVGGLVTALAVGLQFAFIGDTLMQRGGMHVLRTSAVAGGLAIVSQLGDLFESGLKRHFGAKDSSNLIPGHGGLLDRMDALLAAAPFAALLVLSKGRGALLWG
jgi:phosphatidate cytidylyltransferase